MSSNTISAPVSESEHNVTMETLGKAIRTARGLAKMSQAKLGELTGVSRSAVAQWELNQTTPETERLGVLARVLQLDMNDLLGLVPAKQPQSDVAQNEATQFHTLHLGDKSLKPLPLYRSDPGEQDRLEGFMLSGASLEETERPAFLRHSEKAFGVRILNDKNKPAYRRRDIVIIDPDSPPIEGEDCLFTGTPTGSAGAFSVIGCLVKVTTTLWTVRRYSEKKDLELLRAAFPNAWPIVARYNRR
jgi:transcriptional regulator with XRE-family HTH domain